jgi:molybdate transport system ATP-binding protein
MTDGLHVAIERRLGHFNLAMEFTANREILVLFGPSGSGKSQTLNSIAGLNHPDSGQIELDGEVFFSRRDSSPRVDVPTRHRRVGYVFQQYALFPHLTALENVAFSFRRDRHARSRAMGWLRRMRLEKLADRYPIEVSGGQQQRIAIARALAAEPRVLLLDEPFSALDYPLRQQLHEELLQLQDESPLIVVYVTHNLDEALAMGQRLAIVSEGRIEQMGTAADVVTNPQSPLVAQILGRPNIFEARIVGQASDLTELDWNGIRLVSNARPEVVRADRVSGYMIPDAFSIMSSATQGQVRLNRLKGTVKRKQITAGNTILRVGLENGAEVEVGISLREADGKGVSHGESLWLTVDPSGIRFFQTY